MILHGDSEKFDYLGENETKNAKYFNLLVLAQAGSNDEKLGSKISLDCPFILYNYLETYCPALFFS